MLQRRGDAEKWEQLSIMSSMEGLKWQAFLIAVKQLMMNDQSAVHSLPLVGGAQSFSDSEDMEH